MRIHLLVLAILLFASSAYCKTGIGISGGVMIPTNGDNDYSIKPSFGIFTLIPIKSTFYLETYANFYKLQKSSSDNYMSNMGLSFLFILQTVYIRPYLGISAGISPFGSTIKPDVGANAGVFFRLIANLYGFVGAKYNIAIGSPNISRFQGVGGIEFLL